MKIENDAMFEYLPHSTEDYQRLMAAEENFGSVYSIGIALESENEDFFVPHNLEIVNEITKNLEKLDNVDSVDSVTSIDYVCAEDGSLVATNLVPEELFEKGEDGTEHFVGNETDIAEILHKIGSWSDMYGRVIISDDRNATQLAVHYINKKVNDDGAEVRLTGNERLATLDDIEKIVESALEGSNLRYTIYGDPVISKNSRAFMLKDMICLIPLVVLIVIASLFISFKTVDGTVLPLLSVLMATVWSCGLMALLGVQFSIISSVIPVALIAVDSAYGIHVLTHYYIALDNLEGELTREAHAQVIWTGIKDVFQAVLLAGLTTIVGFISLITSPLEPLHSFAIFTSLGVLIALVLSVTLIPCMLLVKPLDKVGQ
ncbi:MAG: MMPL family transporter, partial [Treponema sp.]|nr:MMPL family transporter [Treponema sp.]